MLRDYLVEIARNLRAHKLRFGLTASGIVWGIMMLTYLSAWMHGYELHLVKQMTKIGQNVVFLFPGAVAKPGIGSRASRPVELDVEDIARIETLGDVDAAAANHWLGSLMLRSGGRTKLVWSYGVTEEATRIRNFEVGQGRAIRAADLRSRARVVFLGAQTAQRMFGGRSPIGESVQVEGVPFRVIGVAAEKGEQLINSGPRDDEVMLLPLTTGLRWFSKDDVVGQIIYEPVSRERGSETMVSVRGLLGLHHGFAEDDSSAMANFYVLEAVEIIELLLLGFQIFLYFAIGITLLVGAAGVMNVMFVLVTERTREIGLRKAVGGSNRAIFLQFLTEALFLTFLSGALGALLGVGFVLLSQLLMGQNRFSHVPVLSSGSFVLIVGVMVLVGIAAGALPALRAARIEPAVSLRSS